jgi:hypothetical protein
VRAQADCSAKKISPRRFCARPLSLALLATGSCDPRPCTPRLHAVDAKRRAFDFIMHAPHCDFDAARDTVPRVALQYSNHRAQRRVARITMGTTIAA